MPSGTIIPKKAEELFKKINCAAQQTNRNLEDITVVAVTKTFPVSAMISAYRAGFSVIGESRIQETEQKVVDFPYRNKTELHFIGHLQSNKAKKAVELFDVIQSIDSLKLAKRINSFAQQKQKLQRIYFQINTGNDPAKFGTSRQDAVDICFKANELSNIKLEGLMVIAPLTNDVDKLTRTFSDTRKIRDKLLQQGAKNCKNLSMGMSGDFELAIQEGATHIRIGTALFGERT